MQTSTDHTYIPKTHFILLILCPKSHRSDPCNLPLSTRGFFGLVCGSFYFFFLVILSPGWHIHNYRSDSCIETCNVLPFQSSA